MPRSTFTCPARLLICASSLHADFQKRLKIIPLVRVYRNETCEDVPDAAIQSERERSSRIDRALGKRMVHPTWYWSISCPCHRY